MKPTNIFERIRLLFRRKTAGQYVDYVGAQHDRLLEFLGIDRTLTGSALSEATYFACCKVLSESLGKLPLKIRQRTEDHGVITLRGHPYYQCIAVRPNPYMTATTFWSSMELCRNHYGNGYAWIDTTDPKHPHLWLLPPDRVKIWYDDARLLRNVPDIYYQYSSPEGIIVLGSEEVLHMKSHLCMDGICGISVREQLGSSIGNLRKSQKLLESLYDSGLSAKAVLQYTGTLNDANVATLVEGVKKYMSTSQNGSEQVIPIPVGFTITPLNMKLTDSQFLEIRQASALQIASAFGVKPYQIGDYTQSSYSGTEAQQLSFLIDTMLFILKQYEEEIAYKLLTDQECENGCFVKFNTDVVLRATMEQRLSALGTAVGNFIYTPNEARDYEDLPHVPGGDQLLGNGNAIPVTLAGRQYVNGKEDEHGIGPDQ